MQQRNEIVIHLNVLNKIKIIKWTSAFIVVWISILVMWIIILPSVFWDFSKEMRSHVSLSIAGSHIKACLHFQQTPSIKMWPPSCLQVRIKASTGLGYTMTGSISKGSNSTFNDDVHGKTSDLFIHKESNCHCKGWGIIELLIHGNRKYLRIKFETKLEMHSTKRKDTLWPEKSLTPKSSSSMNININAYMFHCHDNAANNNMAGHMYIISQSNSENRPQQASL